MERCIDISRHQTSFDANKCKATGVTTVICRLAYGTSCDTKLTQYSSATKAAGMKLGGYGFGTWHYQSKNNGSVTAARVIMQTEVKAWIEYAKQVGCDSWIGIDQELENGCKHGLNNEDNTQLLVEAAQMIEAAGFHPCLYASASWVIANVNLGKFKWPLWIAYYKWYGTPKSFDNASEVFPTNSGTYGKWMNSFKDRICMWQFSSEGYADAYGCAHGSNGLDKNWLYFQPETNSEPAKSPDTGIKFDEYCLFPMDALRITQGCGIAVDGVPASTYSHLNQKAYDLGGEDTGKSPVKAPFSCKVVRIYNGTTVSSKCNFTWYVNTKSVLCADGVIRQPGMLLMMTAHCDTDTMTKYGIKVGAQFAQGAICGYEGTATGVANHCHITFGEGPFDGKGWHALTTPAGSYEMNKSLYMHQICFLRPDCKIINDWKYPWKALPTDVKVADIKNVLAKEPQDKIVLTADCFPKYTGTSGSIAPALKSMGIDSSYDYRSQIAAANDILDYKGTAAQNTKMLSLLKDGLLIKPSTGVFKPYTGSSGSIVTALNNIGENSTYNYRCQIAVVNDIAGYRGTAAQNVQMLNLLKQGKLVKP